MTNSARIFVFFCLAFGGCSSKSPADLSAAQVLSTTEVIRSIHSLNGKEVTVAGWIGHCNTLDCGLYFSKSDLETARMPKYKPDQQWLDAMDRRLSVGYDPKIESGLLKLEGEKIRLRARVSDECRGPRKVCLDRAAELQPITILSV